MGQESRTDVIYRSGASEGLPGWDVMQVVYRQQDGGHMRIANSFVVAPDASGKIIRKTDILLDRWEVVRDEEMLRGFQKCFDNRDRTIADRATNPCKCGHPYTSHTKDVRESDTTRVDDALLPKKRYDIFSDRPAGESGCTECSCRQWMPAAY